MPISETKETDTRSTFDRHALGLLLVPVIWGTTFVLVKTAIADVSPILFVGIRFGLATLAALPILRLERRERRDDPWRVIRAGIPLGLVLAGAYATQTVGLATTTPSRSAFVTGLNVTLVPVWALILTRRRPGLMPILGLLVTLPGLWLLTSPEGGSWRAGDSWTLACAILYALYVVLLGRWGGSGSAGRLLVAQLAATSYFALLGSLALEEVRFQFTPRLAGALALTAIAATTGTVWLQTKLQPKVGATRSAVIYATEPLFAALFSRIATGEILSPSAWTGGGIILAGMLLSEIGSGRAVPERS